MKRGQEEEEERIQTAWREEDEVEERKEIEEGQMTAKFEVPMMCFCRVFN